MSYLGGGWEIPLNAKVSQRNHLKSLFFVCASHNVSSSRGITEFFKLYSAFIIYNKIQKLKNNTKENVKQDLV